MKNTGYSRLKQNQTWSDGRDWTRDLSRHSLMLYWLSYLASIGLGMDNQCSRILLMCTRNLVIHLVHTSRNYLSSALNSWQGWSFFRHKKSKKQLLFDVIWYPLAITSLKVVAFISAKMRVIRQGMVICIAGGTNKQTNRSICFSTIDRKKCQPNFVSYFALLFYCFLSTVY